MEETSVGTKTDNPSGGKTDDHLSITEIDLTESISFQETDALSTYELLDRLDSEELTNLRIHFYEKKVDEKIKEPKGSAHPRFRGSKLTKDEFIYAVADVLDTNDYETAASELFDRIVEHNAEEHKGFMWWEQVLDELIEYMSEKTKSRPCDIIKEPFCRLYTMNHCKRESIVRVVPLQTPTSFCYVVVSKYGKIGIYDWSMKLLEQYEVRLSTQIATTAGGEVRRTTWVTDAAYMSDAAMLMVAASDRSLHFYSATGLVCVPVYHISGLPNTPTCVHYTTGSSTDDPSMLFIGDDHGSITTMHFLQPHYALFRRINNDGIDTYFWKELGSQKAWVIISTEHDIHKDEITRVEYYSDNNTVVSCSNDPNTTVIIRYIVGRRAPYVFKISRGVRCFHLDRSLKLMATGGKDSVIRLWNPIIPRKPLASLFGHKTCIVDVRILKHLSAVLSMCKDTVVKVWDIGGQTCMQSLPLLFPVFGALARTPEFGVQAFYPGPVSCEPPPAMSKQTTINTVLSEHPSSDLGKSVSARNGGSFSGDTLNTKSYRSPYSELLASSEGITISESEMGGESIRTTRISKSFTSAAAATDKAGSSSTSCTGSPWTRMELLAVCCNYVVILQLSERELEEDLDSTRVGEPRDPPLHNQDPVVPSPWLTVDTAALTGITDNFQLSLREDTLSSIPPMVIETLQKSLGEEMTQQFTTLAVTCHDLTAAKPTQQTDLKQIRAMVEQCAPHLALQTTELEQIPFTPAVAMPTRKDQPKGDDSQGREASFKTVVGVSTATADDSNPSSTPHGDTSTTSTTNVSK